MLLIPSDGADAATSGVCGDGVAWEFDSDSQTLFITYTGSGTGKMDNHNNPTKYEFYPQADGINKVIIGEGVTSIGHYAFYDYSLQSVTLSSTVEETGIASFYGNNLTEIDLKNVTIIGEAALGGNKLTSIVIPQTVKVIGDYSFKRCIDLASVEFSDSPSVFYIGTDAFDQTSLSEFCVPATVTFLGSGMIGNSEVDYIDVDPANEYYVWFYNILCGNGVKA